MSEQLLLSILEEVKGINRRIDGLEHRFEDMEKRFEGVGGRFDGLEARIEGLDKCIDKLERAVDEVKQAVFETHWSINDYGEELDRLNGRVDLLADEQTRQEKLIGALAAKWLEHEQAIRESRSLGSR